MKTVPRLFTTIPLTFLLVLVSVGIARADRNDLPIVLTGVRVPLLAGQPVGNVYVLVYDAAAATWQSIPYQIDERQTLALATCFNNPALGNVDNHLSYVFSGLEGNGLDSDDEIVFMTGDAIGDQAPGAAWPSGTDDVRYEVRINDGLGSTLGYCYIFTAASAPVAPDPTDYVSYSFIPIDPVQEDTAATTPLYRLHYGARWRLDELAVLPAGGGSGTDMIDRFKNREGTDATAFDGETEETWDAFSCFLGHRDGPVRVLREIQGAASGVNTTQTISIYRAFFVVRINLRVHAIPNVVSFVDYNAASTPLTYFNPANPAGITIDGVPDPAMNMTLGAWEMVSHPTNGSIFYHRAEPIPPPALSEETFIFEAATFADSTGDDEPGRYGCHGVRLNVIASTDEPGTEAVLVTTVVPLPAATGNVGATLADEIENPPFGFASFQIRPVVLLGDLNCDGLLDMVDFPLFVEALVDPAGFSGCDISRADMNGDGFADGVDIQMFVDALLLP